MRERASYRAHVVILSAEHYAILQQAARKSRARLVVTLHGIVEGALGVQKLHQRRKSGYMSAVSQRVDARHCVEVIRTSGVRLPLVDYARLLADGESKPDGIPLFFLVNLARVHAFAAWHGESAR